MIKMIGTAYKRDDFSKQAFFDYWRDVHAPITAGAPGIRGYVVSVMSRYTASRRASTASSSSGSTTRRRSTRRWRRRRRGLGGRRQLREERPGRSGSTGVYIPPPIIGPGSLSRQAWIA
ncbi:MAG: EthD domain-containing protein [Thermoleophilia bacterium]